MERVPTAELLDTDAGTPEEVSSSLRDLDNINRWFGGIHATHALVAEVARVAGCNHLSLLEVASGSGNTIFAVEKKLQNEGITLDLTLLDRSPSHLTYGTQNGHGQTLNRHKLVSGDALSLPFQDNSFDLVSCNLFVHHLNSESFVKFANDALRICRRAVIVNDLVRNWPHLGLVYAGLPLFRSRITWHDAPASVRQAYTRDEIRSLLNQTTAKHIEIRNFYLFRFGAIAWKTWDPSGTKS